MCLLGAWRWEDWELGRFFHLADRCPTERRSAVKNTDISTEAKFLLLDIGSKQWTPRGSSIQRFGLRLDPFVADHGSEMGLQPVCVLVLLRKFHRCPTSKSLYTLNVDDGKGLINQTAFTSADGSSCFNSPVEKEHQ